MRLALIVAFLGSLTFAAGTVEARPGKAAVASKQKAKKKVKPVKKATRKKVVEEEAPMIEEETKPVAKQEARQAISVAGLIDRYFEQGPATKPSKRASSWANVKRIRSAG